MMFHFAITLVTFLHSQLEPEPNLKMLQSQVLGVSHYTVHVNQELRRIGLSFVEKPLGKILRTTPPCRLPWPAIIYSPQNQPRSSFMPKPCTDEMDKQMQSIPGITIILVRRENTVVSRIIFISNTIARAL